MWSEFLVMHWSPSIVPGLNCEVHIDLDDFGRIGRARRVREANLERMMRAKATAMVLAALFLCALSSVTEARQHHRSQPAYGLHPSCNVFMPCEIPTTRRTSRGRYVADQMGRLLPRRAASCGDPRT